MWRTTIRALVAPCVALVLVAGACSSATETVVASRDSNVRDDGTGPADDAPDEPVEPSGDTGPYCEVADELRSSSIDLEEDPDAAIDGLERLRDEAPQELGDEFDLVIDVVGQLAELDQADPANLGRLFELALDPSMLAALAQGDLGGDEAGGDTSATGDGDAIRLADVDAVKEANADASWVAKLSSTTIGGGTDVQVAANFETLTEDEALAACRALREALVAKNPEVRITVLDDETPIVSDEGGTCAPV
jgi:hypothetical protein